MRLLFERYREWPGNVLPVLTVHDLVVEVGGKPVVVTLPAGAKPGSWNRTTVKSDGLNPQGPIAFKAAEGLEIMNVFYKRVNAE